MHTQTQARETESHKNTTSNETKQTDEELNTKLVKFNLFITLRLYLYIFSNFGKPYGSFWLCARFDIVYTQFSSSFRFSLLIFVCFLSVRVCAFAVYFVYPSFYFILFRFGCCSSLLKSLFALVFIGV